MHHCLLTESFPKRSLIDRYHQVGPSVELTYSWAGEIPVGNSLIVGCFWQGREMHFPIAGQDLLLNNRMWSNTAKQWLPANGCAHAALLHKNTLGPVCFNLFDWLLSQGNFWFHMLCLPLVHHSFHCIPRHARQQRLSICHSNSCHMIACATYIIAKFSKWTRMSKPAHVENYFDKP